MPQHRHAAYEEDLARLTARVGELERQVRMMRALQSAARIMLGLGPEPPEVDE